MPRWEHSVLVPFPCSSMPHIWTDRLTSGAALSSALTQENVRTRKTFTCLLCKTQLETEAAVPGALQPSTLAIMAPSQVDEAH